MTVGNSTTPGVCWTIVSDRATRAMAYVGMTRGRDENHLAIYPAVTNEAHQHHHGAGTDIHQMRRGTKYAAAHVLPHDPAPTTTGPHHARRSRTHRPRTAAHRSSRPCSTATTNAAPTARRPGGSTTPKPAPAKPPTSASPPPAAGCSAPPRPGVWTRTLVRRKRLRHNSVSQGYWGGYQLSSFDSWAEVSDVASTPQRTTPQHRNGCW